MCAPVAVLNESFLSDAFAGREGQTSPLKGRAHAAPTLCKTTLVRDLKHSAKKSDAAHAKLVADLKSKYCELARDKQRDKKSVNNVSLCHQLINCLY
jgi:hypothetical protein